MDGVTITLTPAEAKAVLGLSGWLNWVRPRETRELISSALQKIRDQRHGLLGEAPIEIQLDPSSVD